MKNHTVYEKNPAIIKKVVLSMGGTVEEFIPERGCFYINVLGKRILIERKFSMSRHSFVSRQLTACKDITYKLLCVSGLPTPKTECFYQKTYEKQKAEKQLGALKYPIVVKDARGSQCKGLFSFVRSVSNAAALIERELPRYRSMVAQEMVFGKEYRILVLDDKIIGALELISPYIVGDGLSTVSELIAKKRRGATDSSELYEGLDRILREQGIALGDIVSKSEIVYVREKDARAQAWKMRDATDEVHPNIKKLCVTASKVVGKYLVGIDVVCDDISKDISEQTFHILEINGKPDLHIHYNPAFGKARNVAEDIIRFMAISA